MSAVNVFHYLAEPAPAATSYMTETNYDVFISHAYEDKDSFANELAVALKRNGLKVWYSGFELRIGDSIAQSVNEALKAARFTIVIISPVYLTKKWAMNELNSIFSQETDSNRILPVLHNITVKKIQQELPVLADRYAISSGKNLTLIVNKIMQVVKGKRKYVPKKAEAPEKKAKDKVKKTQASTIISNAGFITLGGTMNISGKQIAGKNINNKD